MKELLEELDTRLLFFINGLNNPLFDFLFSWISDKWIWIPLYLFLAILIYRKYGRGLFVVLVITALIIALSDQIASSVIKPMIGRLRPCHNDILAPGLHLVNNKCGGMFGFVSSHAANTFALACFISSVLREHFRNIGPVLFIWAAIVSLSRVYLGVHFPSDVIGGAIVGIVCGMTGVYLFDIYRRNQQSKYHTYEK